MDKVLPTDFFSFNEVDSSPTIIRKELAQKLYTEHLREIARLKAWKAEALIAMAERDEQREALDNLLPAKYMGRHYLESAVDCIRELRRERDELKLKYEVRTGQAGDYRAQRDAVTGAPGVVTPCANCGRQYGHLDNCRVKWLHEQLDDLIAQYGTGAVRLIATPSPRHCDACGQLYPRVEKHPPSADEVGW